MITLLSILVLLLLIVITVLFLAYCRRKTVGQAIARHYRTRAEKRRFVTPDLPDFNLHNN